MSHHDELHTRQVAMHVREQQVGAHLPPPPPFFLEQAAQAKLSALEAALAAARAECSSLQEAGAVGERERAALAMQLQGVQRAAELADERCELLAQQAEQVGPRTLGCQRCLAQPRLWCGCVSLVGG